MKKLKTGKIDFTKVLSASAAGMAFTVGTNALANGTGAFATKFNANRDEFSALGATAAGAGLLYFLPGKKWAEAAGYGLIGVGGAIAANYLTNKAVTTAEGAGLNGLGDMLRKFSPAGAVSKSGKLRELFNKECACANNSSSQRLQAMRPKNAVFTPRAKQLNGGSFDMAINSDIYGLN